MTPLPPPLDAPIVRDGKPLVEVLLDLTAYLPAASVDQLDYLVGWYKDFCPPKGFTRYKIAELFEFDSIRDPNPSKQGQAAAQRREPLPFLAPVRRRILDSRPFEIRFWDGRPAQAFGFSHWQVRGDDGQLHAFVRVTLPLDVGPEALIDLARKLLENVPVLSGHAGLTFGYDSNRKFDAFTAIYPFARRYWGIDVEDLNGTLPLMREWMKGVGWLTLIGAAFQTHPAIAKALRVPETNPLVQLERPKYALLFRAGAEPVVGDRHRPDQSLDPFFALGGALAPLIVRGHPSFSGNGFIDHDDTNAYLHRFDDPSGLT